MYKIIHLSLERCLSPARGKSTQKNSEVKRTSYNVVQLHCTCALEAIYRYIINIYNFFIIDIIVLYQHFYHKNLYAHQYNISTQWNILKYAYDFPKCTIGRTSRVTFGIPAKRLNITIYPILYHWWFSEL